MRQIDRIVIHYTGATAKQSVESIKTHWRVHNLWGETPGYHIIISPDGSATRLQADNKPTYGVANYNAHSLHVCFIGDGPFTAAQEATLEKRVRYWKGLYPNAQVVGHRDLSPDKNKDGRITPDEWLKACPGFSVRDWCLRKGI